MPSTRGTTKSAATAPPKARPLSGAMAPKKPGSRTPDKKYTTTSTYSPRMKELHERMDREIRARFPNATPEFEYEMHGWQVPRAKRIETWKGTIDPNYLYLFIAERKQGITLHFWNPLQPASFGKHKAPLTKAGFKVMVGCLQYTRKGDYPVEAVLPLLDEAAEMLARERQ